MARSSTTFKPGNTFGAKPGNKLALRHGVHSRAEVEALVPAKVGQLFEQMPWLVDADYEGVKSFAYVCVQEDKLNDFLGKPGIGLFTTRGMPRPIYQLWKEINHSKREWMKVLAMGAGPRSQYAQAMSGAGKNMVEVRSGLKSLHSELQ